MALEDYVKAYKLGKRDYQYRMLHGMQPTVQVLDDILPGRGTYSEVSLGLVQGKITVRHRGGGSKRKYRICIKMGKSQHKPYTGRNQGTH